MASSDSLFRALSQHQNLPIRLVAPGFGHVSPEAAAPYAATHRLSYYFFFFLWEGAAELKVDLETFAVAPQELVFALPHQVRQVPAPTPGNGYYKLGLQQACLARLPRHYPFLLNPLNQQKIRFTAPAAARVSAIFGLLTGLLRTPDAHPELILVQLHSLFTEIDVAYFAAAEKPADERLTKYLQFGVFVEDNLTEHPTVGQIAAELAVSPDSLCQLVKHYAGLSPKEFITNRLMLEAQRRLYYGEWTSVKELAFELGFHDPAYFSRLFKKVTGQTAATFLGLINQQGKTSVSAHQLATDKVGAHHARVTN
ncbi:helix-turn-helix domain-containing protein [Hymenobacter coccineus]|uniref:AraC family transcriptional regulator n=1 Tax=Hymenobacter coccineus TaxID=1908235 RepID=A0A1G1TGM4_9BACT|nr:helix-turn-helix domain-containing protein [Hymenobacter coccineus]OGX90034.1 AraC family transcriptional regulator [Hymenobacter coccineus]